jgi:hypothetical protein
VIQAEVSIAVPDATTTRALPLPSSTSNASPALSAVGAARTVATMRTRRPSTASPMDPVATASAPMGDAAPITMTSAPSALIVRCANRSSTSPVTTRREPASNEPPSTMTAIPPLTSAMNPPPSLNPEPVSAAPSTVTGLPFGIPRAAAIEIADGRGRPVADGAGDGEATALSSGVAVLGEGAGVGAGVAVDVGVPAACGVGEERRPKSAVLSSVSCTSPSGLVSRSRLQPGGGAGAA